MVIYIILDSERSDEYIAFTMMCVFLSCPPCLILLIQECITFKKIGHSERPTSRTYIKYYG